MASTKPNLFFRPGLHPLKGMLFWVPSILWYGGICYLSSLSSITVADAPFAHFDKFVHAGIFLGLSAMVFIGFHGTTVFRPAVCALLAFLLTTLYGGIDEYHQSFVDGRHSDVADWVADTVGAAGSFGMLMIKRYRNPA